MNDSSKSEPNQSVGSAGKPGSHAAENEARTPSDRANAPQKSDLPEREPLTPELVEDEALRGDFMMRWATVLLALLLGFTAIEETATLLHVKSGGYTLENFLPARTGVFSATASERSWANLSWLYDVLLAAVYGIGNLFHFGDSALSIFKALLAATTFGIVVHTNRKNVSTWWGTICAALAVLACYRQFTALPENVTLLGIALTLWMLHRWREDADGRFLKGLVALFLVWGNLDPRMFLGLAILVLYSLGETAGNWLGFPGLDNERRRIQLWKTAGLCVVVTLINPFGWNALLSPVSLYSAYYPTMQSFHAGLHGFRDLQYFPLTIDAFWDWGLHDPAAMAALLLMLTAAVSVVLNYRRVDLGDVVLWLGFVGFAMAAAHELAAAAVVSAVVAALNAQQWYQHTFRQTYSVEASELAFSRGGRAATVVALFGFAYLTISGIGVLGFRLDRRVGIGFDADLQASIDGMRADLQDSYDDRPFNFVISQGDVLVWIDKQPFIDSRVELYTGDGDDDLVGLHLETRRLFRQTSRSESAGRKLAATLDRFDVTHVVPRLDSRLTGSDPDYATVHLLMRSRDWKLTRLGATVAVFYRTAAGAERGNGGADEALQEYVKTHGADFIAEAFRTESEPPEPRAMWARGPTFFERYMRKRKGHTSNPLLASSHYLHFIDRARSGTFSRNLAEKHPGMKPLSLGAAFAHLAIRNANEALQTDPLDAQAYRNLGGAYSQLAFMEAALYLPNPSPNWETQFRNQQTMGLLVQSLRQGPFTQRRYLQSVGALRQALVLEPDDVTTLRVLFNLYQQHGQPELAFRTLQRANQLARERGDLSDDEARTLEGLEAFETALSNDLERRLEILQQNRARIPEGREGYAARRQLILQAVGVPCTATAIEVFEEDAEFRSSDLQMALLWIQLLQQAGRFEEADAELATINEMPDASQSPQVRRLNAYQSLAKADYASSVSLWKQDAEMQYERRVDVIVDSIPLVMNSPDAFAQGIGSLPASWPLRHFQALGQSMLASPEVASQNLFHAALAELEAGNSDEASALTRKAVQIAPVGGMTRNIAVFYLQLLTGETVPAAPAGKGKPDAKTSGKQDAGKGKPKSQPMPGPRPAKKDEQG